MITNNYSWSPGSLECFSKPNLNSRLEQSGPPISVHNLSDHSPASARLIPNFVHAHSCTKFHEISYIFTKFHAQDPPNVIPSNPLAENWPGPSPFGDFVPTHFTGALGHDPIRALFGHCVLGYWSFGTSSFRPRQFSCNFPAFPHFPPNPASLSSSRAHPSSSHFRLNNRKKR